MSAHVLAFGLFLCAIAALSPYEKDGKWGYRDQRGQVAISPRYQVAQEFSSHGIAAVVDEQGWAIIDRRGSVLLRPFVVDNGPDYFVEDRARFIRAGKVGFFDRRGAVVVEPVYDFAMPFSQGLAAVCRACVPASDGEHFSVRGGQWGFIDRSGALLIPLRFEQASSFDNGQARVRLDDRWRYIDRRGRLIR